MDYELRMEGEDSHDIYFHTLLLWLAKWVGGGGGARDYKLPAARAQSAGLIILALTSQVKFVTLRDKVQKSQIYGKCPFDQVAGESCA
jgi:hypothetical protein